MPSLPNIVNYSHPEDRLEERAQVRLGGPEVGFELRPLISKPEYSML